MIYLLPLSILIITGAAVVLYGSRGAQLKNMARSLHLRYDKQVDNPLTQEASKHVHLFNRGLHQFYNVLTWKDSEAFIRVSDARVFASPLDRTPQQTYTLVSAELTRGSLISFVLMPRTDRSAPTHAALPPELAARYTLTAPADYQLPASVLGILKAGKPCYIEASEDALLYHEYTTATLDQIQPMRFRVKQLIQELRRMPTPTETSVSAPLSQKTDAELQAEVLLKLKSSSTAITSSGSTRLLYGFILLVFLIAMCGLAWFALQQVAPR